MGAVTAVVVAEASTAVEVVSTAVEGASMEEEGAFTAVEVDSAEAEVSMARRVVCPTATQAAHFAALQAHSVAAIVAVRPGHLSSVAPQVAA